MSTLFKNEAALAKAQAQEQLHGSARGARIGGEG